MISSRHIEGENSTGTDTKTSNIENHIRSTPFERLHYENTPMQYTAIFHGCKNVHFQMKNFNIFAIFA